MGLDMYVFVVEPQDAIDDFTVRENDRNDPKLGKELHYWRKHHDLHGWIEQMYRRKGGRERSFNGTLVRITLEDLDQLERDIKARFLPPTTGFFFGNSPPNDESDKDDFEFISKARKTIQEGKAIYYMPSW
ncbi:phosphoglycerate kinase [Gonapodya prolifera JEL478]|uniref:Phosphoglycerate kinase n=1 Tax=Gonapodya prolifera (strain JEL478) TaxID=1344416 RepID=A0A139AW24_GONPJ|nr:phosphoglycerate kinase [Gonapodya prolifera JEL478]|eukprot:KXS20928.1 phosphoglycerate kinase [Gonapodya prolifera JEL478]